MRARSIPASSRGLVPLAVGLAAALLLVAPPSAAQDEEDEAAENPYTREGRYVGLAPLFAFRNDDDVDGAVNVDNAWGVTTRIGYRFEEHVALELQVEVPIGIRFRGSASNSRIENLTAVVPTLNVRYYPFGWRFQPYFVGGLGPGFYIRDGNSAVGADDDTDIALTGRAGLGVDMWGNEELAINVEGSYVWPTGRLVDIEYGVISFGFLSRF